MKLDDFKLATLKELIGSRKKTGLGGAGILTGSPGGVHPTIVYKMMWDKYGACNTDQVGEHSTWEWVFKTDKGLLCVYDHKGGWSIGYRGNDRNLKNDLISEAKELAEAIKVGAQQIKFSKKQIQNSKIGGKITNPYIMFSNDSFALLDSASSIIKKIEKRLKSSSGADSFLFAYNEGVTIASLYRSAFISAFLSIEGFINLIYFFFLKDRYRNEIYERRLLNEMITTKLLEIDKYCEEVVAPVISPSDELFKAFQCLVNIRNDFMHANIVSGMEEHLIVYQDFNVVTKDDQKKLYGINSNIAKITNIDVLRAQKIAHKLVVRILNSFSDRIKYIFGCVHMHWSIFYLYKDGKVIFPLRPDDYVPDEEIEKILNASTELDEDYYSEDEKEYIPLCYSMY